MKRNQAVVLAVVAILMFYFLFTKKGSLALSQVPGVGKILITTPEDQRAQTLQEAGTQAIGAGVATGMSLLTTGLNKLLGLFESSPATGANLGTTPQYDTGGMMGTLDTGLSEVPGIVDSVPYNINMDYGLMM